MSLHLVTGGAGFVGSALADSLQKCGQNVRVFDINIPETQLPGVEYVRGDILSESNLAHAMRGVSYVHHAAAVVPLHRTREDFHRINFAGTKNTYLAARDAGVKHFCYISTSAVYGMVGSADCPMKLDFAPAPLTAYGKSKLAAEQFIVESQVLAGAPSYSILRPRTVIGPGRLGLLQLLFEWIRLGCHVYLPGDGMNKYQLLDVRDLAQASVSAAMGSIQGTFLLGAEVFGTLFEDLSSLCSHAQSRSQVRQVHPIFTASLDFCNRIGLSPLSRWHIQTSQHNFYFDLTKAQTELNWRPKYSNQQMLAESFDWYLANRHHVASHETSSLHQRPLNWGILALTKVGGRWMGGENINKPIKRLK
jgi:nucleoside-diphosphate-sugar epimerase